MTNTATSVYRLRVPGAEPGVLDLMAAASAERGVLVTGSYRDAGCAVLCFRIAGGDTAAIDHATSLAGGRAGATLHTGLGVHARLVADSG